MNIVKILDEHLANKIAAGEVVEKCVSVVKELVENSIDANATEIKIELIEAGTSEIKVIDNGNGMTKEDAYLAFSRHATSKIKDEDDLFRINSLGFRGEALPSIASVSEIILKTSTGNIGTLLHLKAGTIIKDEKSDSRKGTEVTVKNLFYNTPARLKHLKSLYSELANVTDYINKIALAHPNIRFSLNNNNKILLSTDGSNNLLKVIKDVYGLDVAKKMIKIEGSNNDYVIEGYISYPEVTKSNRNNMTTIVNGRIVRNIELNKIINDAYHTYKPDDRYPIVILNIFVDPTLVDVNIHPTKMDIKFSKMEALKELISNLIKKELESLTLIPSIKSIKKEVASYDQTSFNLNREGIIEHNFTINEPSLELNIDNSKEENILKEVSTVERLPELYPIGLVHGTYIICQNDLGMYLIDQHAAKERINYEKYINELGNPNINTINMLIPLTIEMSNSEYIVLKENINILKALNIEAEEMGINTIVIKSHPTWLPIGYENMAIRKIIDIIISKENFDTKKFNEKVAITLSCKLAIKANENISIEEMENLITDLRKCDNPFTCPHGRPTIIHYSNYELEKLFKRAM
ncbi:MAG: DNA mismatch repair endonuclease MutL [Bacilli bacterium]|nr:DNA mismatch repair endonuclease MutL [Bacilli bacterium]